MMIYSTIQNYFNELSEKIKQLERLSSPVYEQERFLDGFLEVLRKISNNSETNLKLTHKEIRAYARSFLAAIDYIDDLGYDKPEISILLLALSKGGIAHYDRAFLASQIIEIINGIKKEKLERQNKRYDNEEDCF